jgi:hypothetical protein
VNGADARERAARAAVPPQAPGRDDPGATPARDDPGATPARDDPGATPARGSAGRARGILPPGTGQVRRRGRRRWVTVTAAGVAVVLAAAAVAVYVAGGFRAHGPSGPGNGAGLYGTTTKTVKRETLSSQTTVSATLGYAGSYTVTAPGPGSPGSPGSSGSPGTFTWLPRAGRVIRQGQVLYRTNNGVPTYLLYGRVPAWRELQEGMSGADVAQLNHDLVRLGDSQSGYIAALGWAYFSWDTRYGLEQLQATVGLTQTGTLPLGQALFEPAALRVATMRASLGSAASGPVFTATSARHVVTISLDAADQSEVTKGDKVTITLPDGSTTPGVISSVGKVATGHGSSAKITVHVRLDHPGAAGHLDQAPVTVNITTSQVKNVLAVPVAALVARPGGYAVEVVGPGGGHRLVPVTPGLADPAAGMVQVTGPGLSAGQRVVVPAS